MKLINTKTFLKDSTLKLATWPQKYLSHCILKELSYQLQYYQCKHQCKHEQNPKKSGKVVIDLKCQPLASP